MWETQIFAETRRCSQSPQRTADCRFSPQVCPLRRGLKPPLQNPLPLQGILRAGAEVRQIPPPMFSPNPRSVVQSLELLSQGACKLEHEITALSQRGKARDSRSIYANASQSESNAEQYEQRHFYAHKAKQKCATFV